MKFKNIIIGLVIASSLLTGCSEKGKEINSIKDVIDVADVTDVTDVTDVKSVKTDMERSYGNTVENFEKVNQVAEYDDNLYYSSSENNCLYKSSIKGENVVKLNEDKATYINIYKDNIYYINNPYISEEKTSELVKVDLDGVSNREVLATEVSKAFIKDDELIYLVYIDGSAKKNGGFLDFNKVVVDLKTNSEIENTLFVNGGATIIDKYTYIKFSKSLQNYIDSNNKFLFPEDRSANFINLVGVSEEKIIVNITSAESNSDYNGIYSIKRDGIFNRVYDKNIKNGIVASNKLYFFDGDEFKFIDLNDNKEESISSFNIDNYELFQFDDIIYNFNKENLIPIYNTKTMEIANEFKSYIADAKPKEKSDDEAYQLVLNADNTYINKQKSDGATLNVINEGRAGEWTTLLNSWNIYISSPVIHIGLSNEYHGICSYIVDKYSGDVFKIPHQGVLPVFLIKDDKIIKEYPAKTN